jgi:N-acetylglucosaminyldiphosphoundecaprenol N-acetyl-beta-D-mannosaminyltransferase
LDNVNVLDCPVTKLDLEGFVAAAEGFIASGHPHYIAVVNAAKIVKMKSDQELRASVLSADLVGADGVPVVWASKLLGMPLPGRVNGTDLMYRLLERASEKNYRVFFFGAQEAVLQKVLEIVRREYPGVQIAGHRNGYFKASEESQIARTIRDCRPDILFIAFSTPKKELWVKNYFQVMQVPVIHGVGGSFDVMAGLIPRAPVWMQKFGLEWFFRLVKEPRRMWRRYLVTNSAFTYLLIREWFRMFRRPSAAGADTQ